ncbi:keywimysin-related RiPP [Amycolatopsis sp. NPDC005003]
MTEHDGVVYEPPTLVKAGDFAQVTLGIPPPRDPVDWTFWLHALI